jgi:hypothetical protein
MPPKLLKASKRPCNSDVCDCDCEGERDDDCRVAEREKQANPNRPAAFLHQFAGHVVDRRDVIGVESVPEAKTIGERSRAEEDRIIVEGGEHPQPCGGVEDEQEGIDRDDSAPDVLTAVVEESG